jgi:hypothetical protein
MQSVLWVSFHECTKEEEEKSYTAKDPHWSFSIPPCGDAFTLNSSINTMHAKMTLARWLRIYVWSYYFAWNAIDFGIFLNYFVLLKELGLECSIYLEYYMDEQNKN